jgi:DNA processing protein
METRSPEALAKLALLLLHPTSPWTARRLVRKAGGDAIEAVRSAGVDASWALARAAREWERAERIGSAIEDPLGVSSSLGACADLPLLLYRRGPTPRAGAPTVAIVGSRDADAYGLRAAELFAAELARHGVVVISGGARGIDEAAHRGAVDAGGISVAVLASGVDRPTPVSSRAVLDAVVRNGGALLSEVPLGTQPTRALFPDRNRLVAGLAHVTLVIQAATQSGALLTAAAARGMARPVLAVPGDVCYRANGGTNTLLARGEAQAVCDASDVLRALDATEALLRPPTSLHWPAPGARFGPLPAAWRRAERARATPEPAEALTGNEAKVLGALDGEPRAAAELARRSGLDLPAALGALTTLEIAGRAARLPGGRYAATSGDGFDAARGRE